MTYCLAVRAMTYCVVVWEMICWWAEERPATIWKVTRATTCWWAAVAWIGLTVGPVMTP